MTGIASRLGVRLRPFARLIALGIAVMAAACAGEPERRIEKVILISIDTLRADYLGVYGAPSGITPVLDAFAETAVVFDDAITQATRTLPSHTSLFYSMHTFVHHAGTGNPPDPQLESPVETLRQAGFRTAAYVGGGQLRPQFLLDRGFETYEIVNTRNISERRGTHNKDRLAGLLTVADDFLLQHRDEPFFLFLHTYEPHYPYNAPQRFIDEVRNLGAGDATVALDAPLVEFEGNLGVPEEAWVANDRRVQYASEVRYVDDFLGQLFDRIAGLELDGELAIVFVSDHGESLGERGLLGHNLFTTEQLRVPMIVRAPGVAARRVAAPVQLIDVMPTVFVLLGLEPPYPFMGEDLSALLRGTGSGPASDRLRFSENLGRAAVLEGPWKVVFDVEDLGERHLFNLDEDPGELTNVASEQAELVDRLIEEYQRLTLRHRELPALFPRMGEPQLDEETLRELRALGYVR